jgi:hypothetical protein
MSKKPPHPKQSPVATPRAGRRQTLLVIVGGIAVLAVVAILLWPGGSMPGNSTAADAASKPAPAEANPQIVANATAKAAMGPRKQAVYPPIPFQSYTPPRKHDVITAAYQFAADHPEITSYVPCFCGCERAGHEGNTDCFVKARGANGDVTEWEEHGLECAVCIDVATRSRQMYESGASVRDIRSAIDKEFGAMHQGGQMPTPRPPAAHATH